MIMFNLVRFVFVLLCSQFPSIDGHGYLFDPVARSSAWLVDESFKQCCTYPGHMEMYCGGVGHQWNSNGGKCGICGEPYDRANKMFEKGGRMYTGKIVKTYNQGEKIDVQVKLSANHQGYFEFRVCNLDPTPNLDATQECLDRRLLSIAGSNTSKFRDVAKFGSEMIVIPVQLPMDLFCEHCVFQWKYTTGNNWGRDPETNQSGPGLGRENETFMGCADITIIQNRTTTSAPPPRQFFSKTRSTTRRTNKKTTTMSPIMFYISLLLFTRAKSGPTSPQTTTIPSTTTSATATTTKTTTTMTTTTVTKTQRLKVWSGLLVAYERGDEVIFDGFRYRCVTSHRSYAGAEPSPLTWALWRKIN